MLNRIGFLAAYSMGIGLPDRKNISDDIKDSFYWRFMLAFPLITVLIQSTLLFTIYSYETPKFLYIRRKRRQCDKALSKVYVNNKDIDRVLSKLKAVTTSDAGSSLEVGWKDLFGENYITALLVVFCMLLLKVSYPLSPTTCWRKCFYDVFREDIFEC